MMKHPNRPFEQALNPALWQSLDATGATNRPAPFQTQPHSFDFKVGIDLDKLNQLVDELDAEAFAEKQFSQL